jgi:hypothetical protein
VKLHAISALRLAEDRCPVCEFWTCRCKSGAAPAAVLTFAPSDSDPDMDEALRRVRQGGSR